MIDWVNLVFNALWLLGLGIVLAVVSLVYYHSQTRRQAFRQVWGEKVFQRWLNAGLAAFCLGLLGTAGRLYEQIVFGVFMMWFGYQVWVSRDK